MKKMRKPFLRKKMGEFMFKNNYFKFGTKIKQQISGNAVETKFVPQYMCIFMNDLEIKFLKGQHLQLLVFILMMLLFIWTHVKRVTENF